MLSVGIDTHLEMHQVEVLNEEEKVMWRGQIGNNRKGFEELLEKLSTIEKSNDQQFVGVYINPTGCYHVPLSHFLQQKGYKVIAVDPRRSAAGRKMENLGRVKSDRVDAYILASLPWRNRKFRETSTHEREPLSELTRERKSMEGSKTRVVNAIHSDLAAVFPEYRTLFDDIATKTSIAVLRRYTLPANISNASADELADVITKASRNHSGKVTATKLRELALSTVGIQDTNGIYLFKMRENVKLLEQLLSIISELDDKIKELSAGDMRVEHLDDMKGIDTVTAASIVSEIGPIKQFDSAGKLKAYGGKAPDMNGSGRKERGKRVTKIRNSYLASTIYIASRSLVAHGSPEFKAVFDREISKGKHRKKAYTAVGNRLLDSICSMLKNGKPYRERIPAKHRVHDFP